MPLPPITPSWRPLADAALSRLRQRYAARAPSGSPDDDHLDADLGCSDMAAREAGADSLPPHVTADRGETTADTKAIDLESARHAPNVHVPYQQAILAIRFAARVAGQSDDWLGDGALTIIRGLESTDSLVPMIQAAFLPADWRLSLRLRDHRHNKKGILVLHPELAWGSDRVARANKMLEMSLTEALGSRTPILAVLPNGVDLSGAFAALLPTPVPLPPMTQEMLLTLLRFTHSATGQIDEASVRAILPPDDELATLPEPVLLAALRAPTAQMVARRLTHGIGHLRTSVAPTEPTLAEFAGESEALTLARRMVDDLHAWAEKRVPWSDLIRSVIFHGPPGTGKTWLARAIGNSADFHVVEASYAQWQAAGHLGDLLREMRASFAEAREKSPSVLIIDEIDAIGSRISDDRHGSSYRRQAITGLLVELDQIARQEGVIVVAACNHIAAIDPAILRPGRFDRHVEMPLPDTAMLAGLLTRGLSGIAPDVIANLARRVTGSSAAAVDAAVREAKALARQGRRHLDPEDIIALLGVAEDRAEIDWRIAIHESGHAVVATALGTGSVERIALLRDGGETQRRERPRQFLLADIEDDLTVHLAGRAAEALVLGEASGGAGGSAQSDLGMATRLAVMTETQFGFGLRGPFWSGISVETALADPRIADTVETALHRAEMRATDILFTRRDVLEGMARDLVQERRLSGARLEAWLDRISREPEPAP